LKASHPNNPNNEQTHLFSITVQNDCAKSSVSLLPAMPADEWLKINDQNYTPGIVVPFVADIKFDFSKLILNEGKCQVMSINQRL